jgi:hypothetical protein
MGMAILFGTNKQVVSLTSKLQELRKQKIGFSEVFSIVMLLTFA